MTSDNYSRFYFEKSVYYYHLHLNLLQERSETAREIERLQKNAAVAQGDILQLNELNEILQKRVVELERLEDDRIVVSVCALCMTTTDRNRKLGT